MQRNTVHEFNFENNLSPFEKEFLYYHRLRLRALLRLFDSQTREGKTKVLNIGLSVFDLMVKENLLSNKEFEYYVAVPSLNFGKSTVYDGIELLELDICNPSESMTKYMGTFDFIIFSGVLEHLFCDDNKVLHNLKILLKQNGVMFLAVPNATSFINRIKLLCGRNIHWKKQDILIGTEFGGYGHIREYTKLELSDLVSPIFDIIRFIPINDYRVKGVNFTYLNKLIPISWSIDIGVLLRKK